MKRYRVMTNEFDYRPNILALEIKDEWEPGIKAHWQEIQAQVTEKFIFEFGQQNWNVKLENFKELGPKPSSLIAYHNSFFSQARDSYIFGSYYPALTGACALGERIFNQLILGLKEYYRASREYRSIFRKSSFDNWDLAINTLEAWDVLLPDALNAFRELKVLRNRSIHFNFETESNVKQDALSAIKLLTTIIEKQFSSSFNGQHWFISGIPGGAAFIKKEAETIPFVKEILIPNSELVGYKHKMVQSGNHLVPKDDFSYPSTVITDEEYRDLYNQTNNQ